MWGCWGGGGDGFWHFFGTFRQKPPPKYPQGTPKTPPGYVPHENMRSYLDFQPKRAYFRTYVASFGENFRFFQRWALFAGNVNFSKNFELFGNEKSDQIVIVYSVSDSSNGLFYVCKLSFAVGTTFCGPYAPTKTGFMNFCRGKQKSEKKHRSESAKKNVFTCVVFVFKMKKNLVLVFEKMF